jgi:hypothetical protein
MDRAPLLLDLRDYPCLGIYTVGVSIETFQSDSGTGSFGLRDSSGFACSRLAPSALMMTEVVAT